LLLLLLYYFCFSAYITASRLGLYATGSRALSGDQIDAMDISQLEKLINHISVFYRVSPRHKHTIIKVCQPTPQTHHDQGLSCSDS